jgi:HlyD family secretion protein
MRKKIIILAVAIILIASGVYYFYLQRSKQSGSLVTSQETNNEIYKVKRNELIETLLISGEVDAHEKATLFFPTGGKLAWIGAKEGDKVKKYQGIASIDKRDLEKRLQSSLNTYMISRWDFEQAKDDNKNSEYIDGDLGEKFRRLIDKAQFNLNNAVISVELQALANEMSYMYSPIDGIVTKVGATNVGENMLATSTFQVVNPESIYFSAIADQTEVPIILIGQTAQITLDAYEEEKIRGIVRSVSFTPESGDTGTTYEVELDMETPNQNLKYRLGMTGDVEFVTKIKRNVYAVPLSFVKTDKTGKFVYIMDGNKKVRKLVTTGDEGGDMIEIKNGVAQGDILVDE